LLAVSVTGTAFVRSRAVARFEDAQRAQALAAGQLDEARRAGEERAAWILERGPGVRFAFISRHTM